MSSLTLKEMSKLYKRLEELGFPLLTLEEKEKLVREIKNELHLDK